MSGGRKSVRSSKAADNTYPHNFPATAGAGPHPSTLAAKRFQFPRLARPLTNHSRYRRNERLSSKYPGVKNKIMEPVRSTIAPEQHRKHLFYETSHSPSLADLVGYDRAKEIIDFCFIANPYYPTPEMLN